MSFGYEIECPFCGSKEVLYVRTDRYKCLKCEREFTVKEYPKCLLVPEATRENSIPVSTAANDGVFFPSGC